MALKRSWMRFFGSAVLGLWLLYAAFFSAHVYASNDPQLQLNKLYQTLLDEYASPGKKNSKSAMMVDYAAIRKDERLTVLVGLLQDFPRDRLDNQQKKVAFYLNAYNILSIVKVADNWPLKRLKSLGSFLKPVWTQPAGVVCGEKITLRKLEHEILRSLGEPRIHFALNCASMSCPDLRREPYEASKLEEQLHEQAKVFMSQDGKGMRIKGDGKVKLSSIFNWFAEDFTPVGGVENYIQQFLPESEKTWEVVGYLNYDWDVTALLSAAEKRELRRRARLAKR